MRIGILYEGHLDGEPLQELIKRTYFDITKRNNLEFIPFQADGSIHGSIKPAISLFLEVRHCDISIFISDCDCDPAKCKKLRTEIRNECNKINPTAKIIFAFPNPEYEQWLIHEENAVKHVLGLAGNTRLPLEEHKDQPKERLQKLIADSSYIDFTETPKDVYVKISSLVNIKKLKTNNSFNTFYSEFRKTLTS